MHGRAEPTRSSAWCCPAARPSRSCYFKDAAGAERRRASARPPSPSRTCTSAPTATPTWSTPRVGGGRRRALARHAPLPQLRARAARASSPRRPSTRFDEELDAGTDALAADYKRLMRANMADEIDRFAAALARRRDPARGLLGVALHHAVGHQVERAVAGLPAARGRPAPPSPRPRGCSACSRDLAQRAGGRDAVAHRLRLRGLGDDAAQVELAQLGVAPAGQDQRQGDGAVEQVGAAGLAGALGRARTRRARRRGSGRPARCGAPKPARASAAPRARRRAARPAGRRPRTGWPSSARSARGSARRVTSSRTRRRRAASARRAPAPTRRAESARTASALPVAASSANARENSRSPVAVAASRPAVANTVGRPRRSAARSSTSSCTSVAMCSSSTATAAAQRPVAARRRRGTPASAAAACRPADSVPAGVARQLRAVALGHLGQPALGALQSWRDSSGPPGLEHRRELRSRRSRALAAPSRRGWR